MIYPLQNKLCRYKKDLSQCLFYGKKSLSKVFRLTEHILCPPANKTYEEKEEFVNIYNREKVQSFSDGLHAGFQGHICRSDLAAFGVEYRRGWITGVEQRRVFDKLSDDDKANFEGKGVFGGGSEKASKRR